MLKDVIRLALANNGKVPACIPDHYISFALSTHGSKKIPFPSHCFYVGISGEVLSSVDYGKRHSPF